MSVSGAFPLRRCAAHAHHHRFLVALVAVCLALVAGCSGNSGGSAQAASSSSSSSASAARGTYLALGDSVPFGYRGRPAGIDYSRATNFTGYPELVGKKLGLDVVNATCPGETTASFSDVTAQSNGCENALQATGGYRTSFPLHVQYASASQSQLDFAVQTLQHTKDVSLVTLQLGANDAFICQQTTADHCVSEVSSLMQTVQTNLEHILAALRDQGGYRGQVAVVTYYSIQYTGTAVTGTEFLDGAIEAAAKAQGATVADGFGAFQADATKAGGDSQTAGLVIAGDVHPTAKGQELLAEAVERAVR
jgi:lysophospholipase L1-like esterase